MAFRHPWKPVRLQDLDDYKSITEAEAVSLMSERYLRDPDRTISLFDGSTFTSWRHSRECQD